MIIWLYVGFLAFVCLMLALDLGVFNRKAHVVHAKEAIGWTIFWVMLALAFNVGIYFLYENHVFGIGDTHGSQISGKQAAYDFLTGYVIEKSLSLDNIFVIAAVFAFFKVPPQFQHRVLFWGILGALVMRGAMIAVGAALINTFSWITYVFGALLLFTAIKMLLTNEGDIDPNKNTLVRIAKKMFPVTQDYDGQKFFSHLPDGRRAITPMFLVLLVIESTDVIFAVDSIPAIFAITKDSFIVFTSNVFAILGLRSLYFALAAMMDKFKYLKYSLVGVLAFVGGKMIAEQFYASRHSEVEGHLIPTQLSLGIIGATLAIGVIASLMADARKAKKGGV